MKCTHLLCVSNSLRCSLESKGWNIVAGYLDLKDVSRTRYLGRNNNVAFCQGERDGSMDTETTYADHDLHFGLQIRGAVEALQPRAAFHIVFLSLSVGVRMRKE